MFYVNDILNNINNLDIFNFINNILNFKKIGTKYFSLCPFHNEKNPSFILNENNIYYCFGCGAKGNIINFIMNYKNLNYNDAINYIIDYFNIRINYLNKNIYNKKINIYYKINNIICNIYYKNLMKYKKNIFYIYKKKWKKETISFFKIGISNKNQIYNIFKNKKYFNILLYMGYIFKKKLLYKDLFNFRIIFPIKNIYGYIIGFGGRSIFNNNKFKYINNKNSIFFKKNEILFGLFEVYTYFNKNIPRILLVEGYSDVISLYNNNIYYSVSSLSNIITDNQIKLLLKYTNEIYFCYDGDISGKKASIRTLIKILKYITDDKIIKFVFLPNNEDPDSFINKVGKYKFEKFIFNNYKNFYDIILDFYISKIKNFNIFNKIILLNKINKFIKIIPGKLMKKFVKKELINKINIKFKNNKIINNNHKIYIKNFNILMSLFIQNNYLIIDKKYNEIYKSKNKKIIFFLKIYNFFKINNINSIEKINFFFKNKKCYKLIMYMYNYNNLIKRENIYIFFNDTLKWLNNLFYLYKNK